MSGISKQISRKEHQWECPDPRVFILLNLPSFSPTIGSNNSRKAATFTSYFPSLPPQIPLGINLSSGNKNKGLSMSRAPTCCSTSVIIALRSSSFLHSSYWPPPIIMVGCPSVSSSSSFLVAASIRATITLLVQKVCNTETNFWSFEKK